MFSGLAKLSLATYTNKSHTLPTLFYKTVTALTGIFLLLLYFVSCLVLFSRHCGPLTIAAIWESHVAPGFTHRNTALEPILQDIGLIQEILGTRDAT
jgi:hypothetical protein